MYLPLLSACKIQAAGWELTSSAHTRARRGAGPTSLFEMIDQTFSYWPMEREVKEESERQLKCENCEVIVSLFQKKQKLNESRPRVQAFLPVWFE